MNISSFKTIVPLFPLLICSSLVWGYQVGDLKLDPIVEGQATYNSNITEAHSDQIADEITRLILGLKGTLEGPNQNFDFSAVLNQQLYAQHEEFNNLSQAVLANYKRELSPYSRITLGNRFVHAQEPTSFEDQFGRVSGLYNYYQDDFNGQFDHDFSSQWTGQLRYAQSYYDPHRDGLSQSARYKPGASLTYAFSSQTQGSLVYDFTYRTFNNSGNIIKNSPGVGLRKYFTPQLYLDSFIVGDFISRSGQKNLIRPQYSASLNDQQNETTLYSIIFTKQYLDTAYNQDLFDSWMVHFQMKKQISDRLQFSPDIFVGQGEYSVSKVKDNLYGAGLSFTYLLKKNLETILSYAYTNKTSNVSLRDFQKNIFSLTFRFKF